MPTVQITATEMFESLTGYDEVAIRQAFAARATQLAEDDQMMFVRALVFVDLRRGRDGNPGLSDAAAKDRAFELTVRDLSDYFIETEPEVDERDPVGDPGKGGSLSS